MAFEIPTSSSIGICTIGVFCSDMHFCFIPFISE
jgi:hypothetical protein